MMNTDTEGTKWDALYGLVAIALMFLLCPFYTGGLQ